MAAVAVFVKYVTSERTQENRLKQAEQTKALEFVHTEKGKA